LICCITKKELAKDTFQIEAQEYLNNDFLSYTLGHMLGPDFFQASLPKNFKPNMTG